MVETSTRLESFLRMAREFPVRTAIFTFGLPVFACLQIVNGFVYEGSILVISAFAALMIAYSVQVTRYQVAVYRRKKLSIDGSVGRADY